ncbi:MAG: OsmC family peroxiredoxin [Chloroflexi bacterium]|nr:OsmC family peroxiredoxin [Chloroflexota bacterium]
MAQIRTANAHWEGALTTGNGTVEAGSGLFGPFPVTWKARAEASDTGMTSPEELLAAAWASCFSMASSNELAKAGFPVTSNDVSVAITADKREIGFTVLAAHLTLRATVPGVDQATFDTAVGKAKVGCPIARAISPDVEVTLDATLGA